MTRKISHRNYLGMSPDEFNLRFKLGKMSVFIIVEDFKSDGDFIIRLIHRLRFGKNVLPIPAWLTYLEAEQFLCKWINEIPRRSKIIEVSHADLQKMIDERRYDPSCSDALTYYLDLQVDQTKLETE